MAAISQNYARKFHTSIDSLQFKYEIKNEIFDEPDFDINILFENNNQRYDIVNNTDGILICGLFIDGGRWDRENKILLDSPLRFTPLPHFLCQLVEVIKILPIYASSYLFTKAYLNNRNMMQPEDQ